jgi:hypothetical protein
MAALEAANQQDRVRGRKGIFIARRRALTGWPGQSPAMKTFFKATNAAQFT